MLAQQLRGLEADGRIDRTVYPVVPPKTEHRLTEEGRRIVPVLRAMQLLGVAYKEAASSPEQAGEVGTGRTLAGFSASVVGGLDVDVPQPEKRPEGDNRLDQGDTDQRCVGHGTESLSNG
mgnify:CR=1 FL=1